jgi:hypothetical protein
MVGSVNAGRNTSEEERETGGVLHRRRTSPAAAAETERRRWVYAMLGCVAVMREQREVWELELGLNRNEGREGGEEEWCGSRRLAIDGRRPSREVGPSKGREIEGGGGVAIVNTKNWYRREADLWA